MRFSSTPTPDVSGFQMFYNQPFLEEGKPFDFAQGDNAMDFESSML
ncbi:MAG: hypothetical protein HZB41_07630 [Ignavibacteriae bacterium]|nr:hypothetical protein [Ignavibacteriota bacterium]